ncbi:MAG TPA: hypothetical protein PK843_08345 [bacterium]|nr:hypothetical protein [bacterium]HPN34509.1 hypothetical protein [bacterium]
MILFIMILAAVAGSQDPAPAVPDSTRGLPAPSAAVEVSLEDIHIEAVIEKPAVTLIPKRVTPEVGEAAPLTRSFDAELKQRPVFLEEVVREKEEGARMQTAKKNLAKEKK